MKKYFLLPLFVTLFSLTFFSACDDDDGYYDNTYLDTHLFGQWDLIYINGRPVSGYEQNFFDFYNDGSGKYYYYENGQQYWEWIDWWCYNGSYSRVLHVNYSSGAPLNCGYSFNSDASRLYLTWNGPNGNRMEYVYQYTGEAMAPRALVDKLLASPRQLKEGSVLSSALRPGQADVIPSKNASAE